MILIGDIDANSFLFDYKPIQKSGLIVFFCNWNGYVVRKLNCVFWIFWFKEHFSDFSVFFRRFFFKNEKIAFTLF